MTSYFTCFFADFPKKSFAAARVAPELHLAARARFFKLGVKFNQHIYLTITGKSSKWPFLIGLETLRTCNVKEILATERSSPSSYKLEVFAVR